MGCFSGLCKECGKGVKSNSFSGEQVKLFLLENGKVIDQMEGQYDSYGRVFIEGTQNPEVTHSLMLSREWTMDWGDVCDLDFMNDTHNGIAYVHVRRFKKVPTTRSERDPSQGWGDDDEDSLMGNIDPDYEFEEDKDV